MYSEPLVNLYVADVEPSVAFWRDFLGFTEYFRTPDEGRPDHVELRLGDFRVGFVDIAAANRMHRYDIIPGPINAEVVLWTDNVEAEYARALANDVRILVELHVFLDRLKSFWMAGPNSEPIQIVQDLSKGTQ